MVDAKRGRAPASRRIGKGAGVEFAYRGLRRDIVSLTLSPGSALDEAAIAAGLGLSRTPVHEALVRLAAESLVVLHPNRGASVAGMEWDQIREHIEAMDLLQRLVTRWAALRRSEAQLAAIDAERAAFETAAAARTPEDMNESNWRFHALIAAACGNRLIERSYLHVLTLGMRIAHLAYDEACFASREHYRSHMDTVLRDHVDTVQAIRARDADRAEALGRSHAQLGRLRIMDTLARGVAGPLDLGLGDPVDAPARTG